jgi:hypothetical protein
MRIRKSTISARVVSACVARVMVSAFLAVMVIGPVPRQNDVQGRKELEGLLR